MYICRIIVEHSKLKYSNNFIAEIEDLPPGTQEQLYSELLDRDAQRELEEESHIINWSQVIQIVSSNEDFELNLVYEKIGPCHF